MAVGCGADDREELAPVGGQAKRRSFRIAWREPKVVIVYELDEHGRLAGESAGDRRHVARSSAVIELVASHLHRLGAQAREVVFVADGAREPWIRARLDWVVAQVGGSDPKMR